MRDYEPEGAETFQYFHLKGTELAFPSPPVRRLCDRTKRTYRQNTTRNFKYKPTKTKQRCSLKGTDMTALLSTAGQIPPQHAEKYFKYFYGISIFYVFITRFNVPCSGTRISLWIHNKRRYEVARIISVIRNDLVSRNLRPCISSETVRVGGVPQITASLT